MGQALYRKYRSKSLKEVIGQDHITTTLDKAIKSGRISHAYLLTGPRGVGKTSVARILAHEINGLPYTDDSSHIDIIEIDAASNRRIDEIRELREKVYVAPTSAKYKVYIIDEVHMLTKEAFNALLKTLEEPPAHVVFILATTDAHKLPETIVSRTQRFTFKPVELKLVVDHLKYIAKQEKIDITDEALKLIAEHGEGSFRDSISLFDQASSRGTKVEADDVRQLLGIPPVGLLNDIMAQLSDGSDIGSVALTLSKLYNQGFQAASIAKQLSHLLRLDLIGSQVLLPADMLLSLMSQLLIVPTAHDPERFLEITLLGFANTSQTAKPTKIATLKANAETKAGVKEEIDPVIEIKKLTPTKKSSNVKYDESVWPALLNTLKKNHNTLYGVVRMAQPKFNGKNLELAFAFGFHQKRINEGKNQLILANIIHDLTGENVTVSCIVDKGAKPLKVALEPLAPKVDDKLTAISNIFGGGELLES